MPKNRPIGQKNRPAAKQQKPSNMRGVSKAKGSTKATPRDGYAKRKGY